jgi:hypothetical protein
MPLYMDVHQHLPEGSTAKDVAAGHAFCLVEASDAETAATVHREATA